MVVKPPKDAMFRIKDPQQISDFAIQSDAELLERIERYVLNLERPAHC